MTNQEMILILDEARSQLARGCGVKLYEQVEAVMEELSTKKTCYNCKHYVKEYSWYECMNIAVADMLQSDYPVGLEFKPNFGCNQWESK